MPLRGSLPHFLKKLDEGKSLIDKIVAAVAIEAGNFAMEGVVMKTRVKTGRARGNWQATVGFGRTVERPVDPMGAKTISDGQKVIATFAAEPYQTVSIRNSVPYIGFLNDTLGDKMVERTMSEIEVFLPSILERTLQSFTV